MKKNKIICLTILNLSLLVSTNAVMAAKIKTPIDVVVTNVDPMPVEVMNPISVDTLPPVIIESLPNVTLSEDQVIDTKKSIEMNQILMQRIELERGGARYNGRITLPNPMKVESILINPDRGTGNNLYFNEGDYTCVFQLGYNYRLIDQNSTTLAKFVAHEWDMNAGARKAFEYKLPTPVVIPGGTFSFTYDLFDVAHEDEFGSRPCGVRVYFNGVTVN